MIYGLAAALGWGLSDLWAAMSGRRIGSGRTVVIAQVAAALLVSAILIIAQPSLDRLPPVAGWLVANGFLGAAAFATLYRALQLGPIAVVSPVLATYAVIPVLLSVRLLDESLDAASAIGVVVTIAGAVLTSTDLRALREGTRSKLPGVPWAIVSTLLFGVATYVMGWSAKEAGFLPSLWFGRLAMTAVVVLAALLDESLDAASAIGVVVTIAGAVLTSTDVRALREGTRSKLPGVPWAIVSTLLFGVATYVMGWSAKEAGFLPSLWFGRLAMTAVVVLAALLVLARTRRRGIAGPAMSARSVGFAAAVGVVELMGTIAYARGAEVGLVSIVTAASATYPLIPVLGGVHLLEERLAPSQYMGIALVVIGLATLGLAA